MDESEKINSKIIFECIELKIRNRFSQKLEIFFFFFSPSVSLTFLDNSRISNFIQSSSQIPEFKYFFRN